jgi:hypothetical protein
MGVGKTPSKENANRKFGTAEKISPTKRHF